MPKPLLFLLMVLFSFTRSRAQTQPACPCPAPKLIPISGQVLDAATKHPVAGAVVHYFAGELQETLSDRLPGAAAGEIVAGADGSYTLPRDLLPANYHVRASAPGYFAAAFYDEPMIDGYRWPADFPPRPSHTLLLKPNHDLLAFGSSQFNTSTSSSLPKVSIATFSPDGESLLLTLPGPQLWRMSLPDGRLQRIDLPAEIKHGMSIEQIGFDGERMMFVTGSGDPNFVGAASAPDFHLTLLPAPRTPFVTVNVGPYQPEPPRYSVEQTSSCDDGDATPHCGQSGSLVLHDAKTHRTTTLKSSSVDDLDSLLNPFTETVVFSESREEQTIARVPVQVEKSGRAVRTREEAGLTLLSLRTLQRSHIELPGDGFVTLHLLAQHPIAANGRLSGVRVAYSKQGDCDPADTDAAQPFAPEGRDGVTRNSWSVCLVTIPLPVQSGPHTHAKTQH